MRKEYLITTILIIALLITAFVMGDRETVVTNPTPAPLSSEETLLGASTLFAQNASVQLNLEVMGTYASVSGNLAFYGEILPDGATCSNGEILKKTGTNDWDCAADGGGSGGSAIEVQDGSTDIGSFSSLSFQGNSFVVTDTTGEALVRLDWTAGPASRAAAQTITGPWTFSNASVSSKFEFTDNLFSITSTGVSSSLPWETTGYASIAFYFGSGVNAAGDCNDSGEAVTWTITGLFGCNASLQPLDATLTALAAYNTNGIIVQTTADTFAGRTIVSGDSQIVVTNGDGVSANPTFTFASDSLNFDEFQNPLALDAMASVTFGAFNWEFNLTTTGDLKISDNAVDWFWFNDDSGSSTSRPFEISSTASISQLYLQDAAGGSFPDCEGATNKVTYDLGTLRFGCETDAGGSTFFLDVGAGSTYHQTTSISFDPGKFDVAYTASVSTINLDWTDAGGPASLSQAETITGNWVNTTNPWADNEVVDTISIIGGIIGANSISGTQTTTGTLTLGDNGDSIIIDASNWDVSTLGKASFATASVSTNFEAIGYASASLYRGLAFGATEIDCNDATDKLLWSAGLFTCGTLTVADTSATGGAGITISTNDFSFNSTEVEATTWGAGGNASNLWTFNLSAGDPTLNWTGSGATISLNFEALGYASASRLFSGVGTVGLPGYAFGSDQDTGLFNIGSNILGVSAGGTQMASVSGTGFEIGTDVFRAYTNLSVPDSIFVVASTSGTAMFTIASSGHIIMKNNLAPTIACTAGSPTVETGSTDVAGEFTAGAAATACTLTFAKPWTVAPVCVGAADSATGLALGIQTTTTTAVFNSATIGGVAINYICMGFNN